MEQILVVVSFTTDHERQFTPTLHTPILSFKIFPKILPIFAKPSFIGPPTIRHGRVYTMSNQHRDY